MNNKYAYIVAAIVILIGVAVFLYSQTQEEGLAPTETGMESADIEAAIGELDESANELGNISGSLREVDENNPDL